MQNRLARAIIDLLWSADICWGFVMTEDTKKAKDPVKEIIFLPGKLYAHEKHWQSPQWSGCVLLIKPSWAQSNMSIIQTKGDSKFNVAEIIK